MVKRKIRKAVRRMMPYARINAFKFGLAGGIITAICFASITLAGIFGVFGGMTLWNDLLVDAAGAIGYSVSWTGLFLVAVGSFIDGFVLTWIFAKIYNKLL